MRKLLTVILVSIIVFPLPSNSAIVGDINSDGHIDLTEAMYALQVASGVYPSVSVSCLLDGRGGWTNSTSYVECDVVSSGDQTYVCKTSHTSNASGIFGDDIANWELLTLQGPEGPAGTTDFSGLTGQATDVQIPDSIARNMEVTSEISSHTGNSSAHHPRYMDSEAVAAIKAADGPDSGLDADLLDGQDASSFSFSSHNHDTQYYTKAEVDALITGLNNLIAVQDTRIAVLETKLQNLTVVPGTVKGMPGPHMIITGANLHVRSGSGYTSGTVNGTGNLIIGYNDERYSGWESCSLGSYFDNEIECADAGGEWWLNEKSGSHNLVIGQYHNYSSYGGLIAGERNTISMPYSSVSGGYKNTASDDFSSVSGGLLNTARGYGASISGGSNNSTWASYASVSGGERNNAIGGSSSISGGYGNEAKGSFTFIGGGGGMSGGNTAFGDYSAILGGVRNHTGDYAQQNHQIGYASTISGGADSHAYGSFSNTSGGRWGVARGDYSFIGGGGGELFEHRNMASSHYSAVLGGAANIAGGIFTTDGTQATVSGGYGNRANGNSSSISGGKNNVANGGYSSVSGGEENEAYGWQSSVSGGYQGYAYGTCSLIRGGQGWNAVFDYDYYP